MTEPTAQREGVHKMLDDLAKKLKEVKEKSDRGHTFVTGLLRYRSRGKLKRLTDGQYAYLHIIYSDHFGKTLEFNINNFFNRKTRRVRRS